jgi:hypothetical protein
VWSRRWADIPGRVRVVVASAVLMFAYGTGAHVVQVLVGGINPYPAMPAWLAIYFVSLTILDAATAVLLSLRRFEGLALGSLVMVSDALANAYANYAVDHTAGVTPGRIGQATISVLAMAFLSALPWLARWFRKPAATFPRRAPSREMQ